MVLREVSLAAPLVVVFAAMCLGIVVLLGDIPAGLFCLFFLVLLFDRSRIAHMGLGLVLAAGAVLIAPGWTDIPDGEYLVQGRVVESGFNRGAYRVTLDRVVVDGRTARGHALINVYENVSDLGQGSVIEGRVRLRAPRALGNEGEFDYRKYLLSQGITLKGYIRDQTGLTIKKSGREKGLRDHLAAALSGYAKPEAEVMKAVLTGDRSGLVYSLRDSFASLGVAHLMAISGLHMGIIFLIGYAGSFTLFRLIPLLAGRQDTPFLAKLAGLAGVLLYTHFVGGSLPAVRSAIMVACIIVSLLLTRRHHLIESLSVAGILILIWMPFSLYTSSFLLSFSAVIGITGAYLRLEDSPRWLLYIVIPIIAAAFTLPITISHFGFVSLSGFMANIVFVPWFSFVVMPLGMAGLAFFPVSDQISSLFFSLSFDTLGMITSAAEMFGRLHPVAAPGNAWVFACYAGMITAFFSAASRVRTILLSLCIFLIVAIPAGLRVYRDHQPLCFDFISVGQGDSTLVTRGRTAILIDAGGSRWGFDTGRFIVGPHLLRRGITKLDIVIITHAHTDHIGGIPFILDRFPTGEVWTNMKEDWSPDFRSVIHITQKKGVPVKNVCLGDACRYAGLDIEILNPQKRIDRHITGMDQNLHSIALKIGDSSMQGLFMGDVEGLGEIRLCRLETDLSADVLKVGHHGSRNSCLTMFLEQVRPRLAVVPVGHGNVFRLPNRLALGRLHEQGITVWRTDIHGEIMTYPGSGGLQVKSGRLHADTLLNR